MRDIRIEQVCKTFRREVILDRVSFTIPGGKFFALLGPSGCGKTTLLRLIGGFEQVDAGKIFLGNEDITHMPINRRRVNTVFQNYALFPHLNVFDNVAYSLRIKGMAQDLIEHKVTKILHSFRLDGQIYKAISELSGGQQQRVALARAVINEPEVLLLDEPLAALDYNLREKMLIELIELQDKLKTTFVYVTHDQFEALTVADQMAIMNQDGQIEQIDTPRRVYEYPASTFVAQFVGTTNVIRGVLKNRDTAPVLEVAGLGSFAVDIEPHKPWMVEGASLAMSIRPEKIVITRTRRSDAVNELRGIVEALVYHGRSTQYNIVLANGDRIQVFKQNQEHLPVELIDYDHEVFLYWYKEQAVVLER